MTRVAVLGGGIAGLAAARRLEQLVADIEVVLVEGEERLGGKLLTERADGYVVEGAGDSFLSRKPRGVGLCEELGLELVGRRPENARSFVRVGGELHPLPEGLTGMIPTNLDALDGSSLLSPEGRERLAAEPDVPPAPPGGDESIASFVTRRLGREAYQRLVEPLMTGIYGGDGELLSLAATFPNLRALELEHGSVLRGLSSQPAPAGVHPPFVSFPDGMQRLVTAVVASLERTQPLLGRRAMALRSHAAGFDVELERGETLVADGVVVALPAFATAELVAGLDDELAEEHAAIPYASSAIVTLAYREEDVGRPLDGYGYVVPSAEGSDVLACTWSSSKWESRAPAGLALVRIYAGRFGRRDVTDGRRRRPPRARPRRAACARRLREAGPHVDPPLAARDAPVRPRPPGAPRPHRRAHRAPPRPRPRGRRVPRSRHPRLHCVRRSRGGVGRVSPGGTGSGAQVTQCH